MLTYIGMLKLIQNILAGITKMRSIFAMLRHYFSEKPSLEDYIAAHNPTSTAQVEYLEKQYERFLECRNFWGVSF